MRELEAGAYCGADADLGGPAQHFDVSELGVDLLGDIAGAVGTVVVDDEDVGVRCGTAGPGEELDDVFRFLVGRSHDERTHRRKMYPVTCPLCGC